MSRIENRFVQLRDQGHKALVPYITAGDPNPQVTVVLMHALVEAGADIIELGVPFSDPMADGPVIQHAHERALRHHVNLHQVLEMVVAFRHQDTATPVVLMGYLNPVEVMGYEHFARMAAEAGVDGVLTVDIPPEEGVDLLGALRGVGLDPIFLVAPTSSEARISIITEVASGFVYYVSVKGVTGAAHLDVNDVAGHISAIRAHTGLPVGTGFGIKDPQTAAAVAQVCDAVIVGSALVSRIGELADEPQAIPGALAGILGAMRASMDAQTLPTATTMTGNRMP